jgi:putative DNA primase/helicase
MTDLDSLKRNTDLVALLESYSVVLKRRGQEWDGLCIAHSETNPSMQVYVKDSVQRWHCKSCGAGGTVIDAIMVLDGCDEAAAIKRLQVNGFDHNVKLTNRLTIMTTKGDKPAMNNWMHRIAPDELPDMTTDLGAPVATWRYNSELGECLGYIARYALADGGKSYRPWTFGAYSDNVKATWKAKTWTSGRRPLYGLDLLAQRPEAKVCIVEGEKAADAARQLLTAMVCITWPGGANGIMAVDWSPLTGRDILLIPDADKTGVGEIAMFKVASILLPLGCKVRILDTSDKPDAWDLADAVAEGITPQQLMEWAKPRISALTSRECEKQREEAEKKTMLAAQPGFDEDSSIYDMPPLDEEPPAPTWTEPLTIDVVPTEIPDAPAVKPAKLKRDTGIKEAPLAAAGEYFSHSAIAKRWALGEGVDWKYCHNWEKWVKWDGTRWKVDKTRSACKELDDHLAIESSAPEANQLSVRDRRALGSVGQISSVLKAASWHPMIKAESTLFDADPFLLGTPDGTVDLRTGKMRESERNDYITKHAAVTPQPGPMPLWEKVLSRCTMGEPDMLRYFQKWAGYSLTGDCSEKAFLFVHGLQDSGKSSFLMTLKGMLGEYATEIRIDALMEQKHGNNGTHELAELYGVRLAMTTEPNSGQRWNESLVKAMTGGEELVVCRKYENPFSFKVTHKILMGGNDKPQLASADGMERRLHIAEFPKSIPLDEQISDIAKKLEAEWPAILAWAIEGCLIWQQEGLAKPKSVHDAVQDYVDTQDIIRDWLSEKTEIGNEYRVKQTDLYASYSEFVKKAGMGALGTTRLSPELKKRGFEQFKSNGCRYWRGMRLSESAVIAQSWVEPDRGF